MSTNNDDATNTDIIELAPPVANNANVDDVKELPWKQTNLKLLEVLFKSVQATGVHLLWDKKAAAQKGLNA